MSKELEQLITSVADKAWEAVSKSSVMGEPLEVDGITVIPIYKSSFGFVGGGAHGKKTNGVSGGAGAAITTEPYAYITVKNGEVSFVNLLGGKGNNNKIMETVMGLVKKDKKNA